MEFQTGAAGMGRNSQIENDSENKLGHGFLVFTVGVRRSSLGSFSEFCWGTWIIAKAGGTGQDKMMTCAYWK